MICLLLPFKAKPIFYLRSGHWGEGGWTKVNWFNWLYHRREYTNKTRWIKRRRKDGRRSTFMY